jgi:hypothetical protein
MLHVLKSDIQGSHSRDGEEVEVIFCDVSGVCSALLNDAKIVRYVAD